MRSLEMFGSLRWTRLLQSTTSLVNIRHSNGLYTSILYVSKSQTNQTLKFLLL